MPFKTKVNDKRKVGACTVKRFMVGSLPYDEWKYMNTIIWLSSMDNQMQLEMIEKAVTLGQLNYLVKAAIKYYATIKFPIVVKKQHFDTIRKLYDKEYFQAHLIFDSTK